MRAALIAAAPDLSGANLHQPAGLAKLANHHNRAVVFSEARSGRTIDALEGATHSSDSDLGGGMFRAVLVVVASACLMALSGCSPPPDLETSSQLVLKQVQAGDAEGLKHDATAAMAAVPPEAIMQLRDMMPKGEPDQTRFISYVWAKQFGHEASEHQTIYEYGWPDKAALVRAVFIRSSDDAAPSLHGVFVNVATREELRVNDFTFDGKSLGHYVMLMAVIATPLLMIYAIVLSIRTPGVKRRWLWCLLSLVAVANVAMDWTTGAWGLNVLAINIIGVGIMQAGAFSPWILATTIPVGALIVIVRMHLKRRAARSAAGA